MDPSSLISRDTPCALAGEVFQPQACLPSTCEQREKEGKKEGKREREVERDLPVLEMIELAHRKFRTRN